MSEKRGEFHWLIKMLRSALPLYAGGLALSLGGGLVGVVDPLAIKWLVDTALPARRADLALCAAGAFVAAQLARMCTGAASGILIFRATQRAALKLRAVLLRHLTALSLDFHSGTPAGRKTFLMDRDVEQIVDTGSSVLAQILSLLSSIAVTIATMFYLSPMLLCAVLPVNALFIALRHVFKSRIEMGPAQVQEAASRATAISQEHLASVSQIQLLCSERAEIRRTIRALIAKNRAEWRRRLIELAFSNASFGIVVLGTASVLAVGSVQVLQGRMTTGALLASYALLARLFDPFGTATNLYTQLGRVRASLRRVKEVLDMQPSVSDCGTAVLDAGDGATLRFEHVSFGYPGEEVLLREIDIEVRAGEKVGVSGRSGSGKTTMARLMARLHDSTSGHVTIGGRDVREYTLHSLRAAVCYVHQEAVLFDRSIEENLLLGNPSASAADLWRALRVAQMDTRIKALDAGLQTLVGQQGIKFSGGERQRLILARALVCQPAILLLDEATGAVDETTEQRILHTLRAEFPTQTVILISHRPSALSWADRIILLEKGGAVRDEPARPLPARQIRAVGT